MPRPPRVYPPEFRQKIMELVRSGRSTNDVAKQFDVSRQTIANWLKCDDLNAGRRTDGSTSTEHAELVRLRHEVKRLKIEQEILSKAATWFARENRYDSEEVFGFVRAHQAVYAVTTQCRVPEVSSGFYAWLRRSPSKHRHDDILLGDRIEAIHRRSRSTYGRPRVHAELRAEGIAIGGSVSPG